MKLPPNHPQRYDLSNEVHARPPIPLTAPVVLTCIALTTNWPYRKEDRDAVVALTCLYGVDPPPHGAKHFVADLGDLRLVWERHTEFTRFTFIAAPDPDDPFSAPALDKISGDWLASLPGEVIAAVKAAMVGEVPEGRDWGAISERYFEGNALIGSTLTGGSATALTDFRIHKDDFSRILILNQTMTTWHAGRLVQRLLEIEVYRIMALIALPVAQSISPGLADAERQLTEITTAMTRLPQENDQETLSRLVRLQASVERSLTESRYRFSAAAAYDAIVSSRIEELREGRIEGMQTFKEFVDRRLAPALNTCSSVARRQRDLSERVERASQLLMTQADIFLARQNKEVLESFDRRAELQLRLQKTVEGLSVAAISYYVVGLIAYILKGFIDKDASLKPEFLIALSVPLVLLVIGYGLIRARRMIDKEEKRPPAEERAEEEAPS
jgi:uncharacterized membrane-anchored protein